MLHEKRKDLDSEKQKKLLTRLLNELAHVDQQLYYRSTAEVALAIKTYIAGPAGLKNDEKALLDRLTTRDIEVLLSLH